MNIKQGHALKFFFVILEMKTSVFPRGNYAVFTALGGCPEDEKVFGWEMGYINMTMKSNFTSENFHARHYWSDIIHLLGKKELFCMHLLY
jgi:hypothetical protein